jgi:hypothetical protein
MFSVRQVMNSKYFYINYDKGNSGNFIEKNEFMRCQLCKGEVLVGIVTTTD